MRQDGCMTNAAHQAWDPNVLTRVAGVLADTDSGLTGKEIGALLDQLNMPDPFPNATKRDRLSEAFLRRQGADDSAKRIITFITHAMHPANYRARPQLFNLRQDALNEVLTFVGLRVTDQGQVAIGKMSLTLSEAGRNATSLRDELRRRGTHQAVLDYCTLELLMKNNFHASMEACKSVFERLREMAGAAGDGSALVDATLALGRNGVPRLAINSLATQSERDEQSGLANLVKGLSGLYRNPVAHDPRTRRKVSDNDLLELLTTLSMVHRRLDGAVVR